MAEVRLQEGETVENALRRFKRQVVQENIVGEVKRHPILSYVEVDEMLSYCKSLMKTMFPHLVVREHWHHI